MIELLTTITIMAILISILMPAASMVRKNAKETQQKTQITKIDMAILSFKVEHGNFPPSAERIQNDPFRYNPGAVALAEALVGQDLMGFHSWSIFKNDSQGYDPNPSGGGLQPLYFSDSYMPPVTERENNLKRRKGPYLDIEGSNAFTLEQLYGSSTGTLVKERYVICDVFGVKKLTINKKRYKAGSPILYYRANTASKMIVGARYDQRIYNYQDNWELLKLKKLPDLDNHLMYEKGRDFFYSDWENAPNPYYKIIDPKASTDILKWPHRADSYILISAGYDGEYGTEDDIFNF